MYLLFVCILYFMFCYVICLLYLYLLISAFAVLCLGLKNLNEEELKRLIFKLLLLIQGVIARVVLLFLLIHH